MPIYHRLGEIPRKRHIAFRKADGSLHYEQLMGNKGFTGPASLLYHLRRPTMLKRISLLKEMRWEADPDPRLRPRHLRLGRIPAGGGHVLDRTPVLFNRDFALSFVQADRCEDFHYRNAMGDELIYVDAGEGVLESQMGELPFFSGDYLVIPRGIIHRLRFDAPVKLLIVESNGAVETPSRYRNEFGQLVEHSPYCERDIRRPEKLVVHDETGEFRVVVKQHSLLNEMILEHHPFDAVGWDGYYYPWALSIHDFEPIVGRLHQPPPVHQTFQSEGFVACSFVPRLFDFHPEAVPVPYNHSNVMSDEVIFYASADFMSRKGIEHASLTLHPDGIPHGPHPGTVEKSIGQKETKELAVMFDTFRPLRVARAALSTEDEGYLTSWLE